MSNHQSRWHKSNYRRFEAHEPDAEHGSDPHVFDRVSHEVVDFRTIEEARGSAAEYEADLSIFQQARPGVER